MRGVGREGRKALDVYRNGGFHQWGNPKIALMAIIGTASKVLLSFGNTRMNAKDRSGFTACGFWFRVLEFSV